MANVEEKDCIQEFTQLIGCESPVTVGVISYAMSNPQFFHNLLVSYGHKDFTKALVESAENVAQDEPVSLEEIKGFITEQKKILYHQGLQMGYKNMYGRYIEHLQKGLEGSSCSPINHMAVKDFREVYLDSNSTTPWRNDIRRIMKDYAEGLYGFGNPSSSHAQGLRARDYIIRARMQVAATLNVSPRTIVFTPSGTAANNLAINGIAFSHLDTKGHIITTKTEHKSVLETVEFLKNLGFEISILDVNKYGMVNPDDIRKSIRKYTILVSVIYANNEIGTINPMKEIGAICKEHDVPLMTDAIQAFGKVPIDPDDLNISMLSLSGHKINAPKGIGCLYVKEGIKLAPLIHGGSQEGEMLAGTENVGHIIALGMAAELAGNEMLEESKRMTDLSDYFVKRLEQSCNGFIINGSPENRIRNNMSVSFKGISTGALLLSLNKIGICVSSSSACTSTKAEGSHVLDAIGVNQRDYATIRFGMGIDTTKEDLDYLFDHLPIILSKLRK